MINKYKILKAIFETRIKGSGRLVQWLKTNWLPPMQSGMVITTLYGFKIKIDPIKDKGIERNLYSTGSYEEGTLDVLGKIIKNHDTFIDAGANIGLMSLFVAHQSKDTCTIIAFEPHPVTAEMLRENIALNQFKNIRVEPFALSEVPGTDYIYDRWDVNRGGSSLVAPQNPEEKYAIQVTNLDTCFGDDFPVHLIKVDVEGLELEVLKGAKKILSRKNPPMLIVEYSTLTGSGKKETFDLYDFIRSFGHFRVFRSRKWKGVADKLVEIHHSKDLPQHDNIYCFTDWHLKEIPNSIFN